MGEVIPFQSLAGGRPGADLQAAGEGTRESGEVGRRPGRKRGSVSRSQRDTPPAAIQAGRPGFYFDLACPFSYIAADRIERLLGDIEWVPVPGEALRDEPADAAELMARAAELARRARLPLVFPEYYPRPVPGAMRAAAYAAENGAGARFALAASRLAFAGGFDLERASVLEDVAAATRLARHEVLAAAAEEWRDHDLHSMASLVREEGMSELPILSVGDRWFQGTDALSQAVSWRRSA